MAGQVRLSRPLRPTSEHFIKSATTTRVSPMDDLNSLALWLAIASLIVGVAAILFAFLTIWMSWQFYKGSTAAQTQLSETAIRIDRTVEGVKIDIASVVTRIMEYFMSGAVPIQPMVPDASEVEQTAQPQEQEGAVQVAVGDDATIPGLAEYIKDQEARIESLEGDLARSLSLVKQAELRHQASLFARYQAVAPHLRDSTFSPQVKTGAEREAAVDLTQRVIANGDEAKTGKLEIEILREVRNATATPRFDPPFSSVPRVRLRVEESPDGFTGPIIIKTGGVTESDFNVHLNSRPHLATGKYVIAYEAKTAEPPPTVYPMAKS